MAHTDECRELGARITETDATLAFLGDDYPVNQADRLHAASDELWAERRAMHATGECPGAG
jgi:hypothetical protein